MPADVPLSPPTWRNAVLRYILAIAATSTLLLACRSLNPHVGDNVTYIILLPVVAFVAWYCGVGPSILTIALALGGIVYWMPKSPQPTSAPSIAALAFLFASAVIVALGEARRRDNEKLRNAQGQLEDRVRERTGELDAANLSLRKLSARLLQSQDDERRRIAQMLNDSAKAVRDAVKSRVEAGRDMNLHYDHPILLLQHMVWHEGYHHGQIKVALKVAGRPITDEEAGPVTWDIWMRKK